MSELPSASTITPPPAATAAIGTVCPHTGRDGIRLACEDLGRARSGEVRDQATLLREVGSAEEGLRGAAVSRSAMFASVRRQWRPPH